MEQGFESLLLSFYNNLVDFPRYYDNFRNAA